MTQRGGAAEAARSAHPEEWRDGLTRRGGSPHWPSRDGTTHLGSDRAFYLHAMCRDTEVGSRRDNEFACGTVTIAVLNASSATRELQPFDHDTKKTLIHCTASGVHALRMVARANTTPTDSWPEAPTCYISPSLSRLAGSGLWIPSSAFQGAATACISQTMPEHHANIPSAAALLIGYEWRRLSMHCRCSDPIKGDAQSANHEHSTMTDRRCGCRCLCPKCLG